MFLIERIVSTVLAGGTKKENIAPLIHKISTDKEIKESFNQGIARIITIYNTDKQKYLDEGYESKEDKCESTDFAARLINGYGIVEVKYISKRNEKGESSIITKIIRYEMHEIVNGKSDMYISML